MIRSWMSPFAALVALACPLLVAPAWATHEDVCKALPTSGQRAVQVSCNPQQQCKNAGGGLACNALPTSGNPRRECQNKRLGGVCNGLPDANMCSGTESYNPRQACIDKLPKPYSVSISSIDGGGAGGSKVYANRDEVLIVRGTNVGLPGNTVSKFDEQVWGLSITLRPNCTGSGCVALAVRTGLIGGTWRFVLKAAHGHSEATGYFQSVLPPSPEPQKSPIEKKVQARLGKPDLYFKFVQHDLWGEKLKFQISNKGSAPSPPALVYMYLYRVDERGRRTSLTTDNKNIIPLCPVPSDLSGAPCPAWWDGEFHVPITSFAKEVEVVIDPGGFVNDSDPSNNVYRLTIPGTPR